MNTTNKAEPRTLYVHRNVANAKDIIAWAKDQGFKTTLPADELHVTIAFSKTPVDWMKVGDASFYSGKDGKIEVGPGGARHVEPLGDAGAVVLLFTSSELSWRHRAIIEEGASWDHDDYQPHITISYEAGDLDLSTVEPYRGKIVFGPEIFEELNEDWADGIIEKAIAVESFGGFAKIDSDMRVVWGWANVYEDGGEPVVDAHGDVIDEADILKAAHTFVADVRAGKVMHGGRRIGTIVESLVLTRTLQKVLGIDLGKAGWFIGMKIDDPDVWKQVKEGTLRAFSFGGTGRRVARESTDA